MCVCLSTTGLSLWVNQQEVEVSRVELRCVCVCGNQSHTTGSIQIPIGVKNTQLTTKVICTGSVAMLLLLWSFHDPMLHYRLFLDKTRAVNSQR